MEMHSPENCSAAHHEAEGTKSRGKLFANLLPKQLLLTAETHTKLSLINPRSDLVCLHSSRGTVRTVLTLRQIIVLSPQRSPLPTPFSNRETDGKDFEVTQQAQVPAEGRFPSHQLCIQDIAVPSCQPQVPLLQVTSPARDSRTESYLPSARLISIALSH